jgi:DMSO/TMAO reductase YedYZ heme-binding membrane subunit
MIDTIFRSAIQKREQIITCFKILYALFIVLILLGGYSSYYLTDSYLFFYKVGVIAGQFGLMLYILTLIPGMARRFGIKYKIISLLMIFRRYLGITMFLGILTHYTILRGAQTIRHGLPEFLPPPFELFGLIALFLTFFLFITSSDFSVQHLKKWWNTIHQLTYIIIFFIALHVVLQGVSLWSITIGTTLSLQLISFIVGYIRKTRIMSPTIPS